MARINAGNFADCLAKIAAKGGRSAEEAQRILQEVHDSGARLADAGAADGYVRAAQELADRVRQDAAADRLDAVRNAKIRNSIIDQVDQNGGIDKAHVTIRSLLHGTSEGSRDSIEAQWKGLANGWQSSLAWELRKAGVEGAAIDGSLDRDVARELRALSEGKPLGGGNGPARQIAEAYKPMLDMVRQRLNNAGARIGEASDYILSTWHDPDKMRAAAGAMRDPPEQAFAAWWKDVEPRLDPKTFDALTLREGETAEAGRLRFGKSVFDALVSGVHMTAPGVDTGMKGFEGAGSNLAKKLSQGRVLQWKDADSWYDYVSKYGRPRTLLEGMSQTLDRGARDVSLMEKLGTNPANNLDIVLRRVQEKYRPDLDGVKAFKNKLRGIDAVMQQLDGRANMPANQMMARLASTVRTAAVVSDLGGVGITHLASVWPTMTSEAAHHGIPRLQMLGEMVKALASGKGSEEKQAIMAQLGAYADGLTRDMRTIWTPDEPIPGRLSGMAQTFMKWTGLPYIFDKETGAMRETLANNLAENRGKAFGELEPHLQGMLPKYGIGSDEWDLLRGVGKLSTADGRAYITPADALRIDRKGAETLLRARGAIPEDAAAGVARETTDQFAQSLSDKLYAYYGDAARHGVITPGVRERAMLLGTSQPGTIEGETRRFLAQFKMWPVAMMHQALGREIYMSLSKGEMAWNLGTMAALSAASGYLRMAINDAAIGNPIRNPLDMTRDKDKDGNPTGLPHGPATMLAALAQGGGVGILGDFMFGEALRSRFGAGLVGTVGGPVASDADALIGIYSDWLHGKAGWPELAHFGVRHIPFANLVYIKGALDYMLFYHLYEAASPGWWERHNRQLERDTGRTMQGYAPGAGVPWTPWGIGK